MSVVAAGLAERFLGPGALAFGAAPQRLGTLLGSCVAIAVWHPGRRIGGMCHYVLPTRGGTGAARGTDGRYADEAWRWLLAAMARVGTRPEEYRAMLFGGSNMFPARGATGLDVAARNVVAGRRLIAETRLCVAAEDLGGVAHRRVSFDLMSGVAHVTAGGTVTRHPSVAGDGAIRARVA